MLVVVEGFSNTSGATLSLSSTGTAFTQIGSTQVGGALASGFDSFGGIFYAVASSTDAGKVITATVGNPGGSTFIALSLASYSGCNTSSPIDVSGGANGSASPLNFPALTTTQGND